MPNKGILISMVSPIGNLVWAEVVKHGEQPSGFLSGAIVINWKNSTAKLANMSGFPEDTQIFVNVIRSKNAKS